MRILVCGGRDFNDMQRVFDELQKYPVTTIIEGGARGADDYASLYGGRNGIKVLTFLADWKRHGKGAGPIRNQQMIDEGKPDKVIAFPGGRGTADMIRRAQAAGIEVVQPLASVEENRGDRG